MPENKTVPLRRPPGFRFSAADAIILILGAAATVAAWPTLGSFAWIFVMVLVHFFFFCNVFRIRRSYELLWAAAFIVNVLGWCWHGPFHVLGVLAVQMPITVALIVLEVRGGRYHGVGHGWLRSDFRT